MKCSTDTEVMGTAAFVICLAAGAAMLINGGRWTLRGIGLHSILVANDMSPGWEPVQPGLYHGVWLLLHPPRESTFTELEQIDIEGRTAMARSCLWTLGGIALLLLGATLKSWL